MALPHPEATKGYPNGHVQATATLTGDVIGCPEKFRISTLWIRQRKVVLR